MARQNRSKKRMREPRLDSFTRAYIEAALWSSTDNADESGGEPLDKNYGPGDISDETMALMVEDCALFQERYADLLSESGMDNEQAGHDFWLSRNRHGTGFWDADQIDEEFQQPLQDAAESFGEFDLNVGDDGLIFGPPTEWYRQHRSHATTEAQSMRSNRTVASPQSWTEQTHAIVGVPGDPIQVHAEDGDKGGLVLYTREEWDSETRADWEQQPDGTITFQGRPTSGRLVAVRRSKEIPMKRMHQDDRDHRLVTVYDDEALQLMPGWTGGQNDPLYAISSMGGQHEAWVFQDAIANLDADLRKVKKLGKGKFQLGKGTFTKKEIDELHTIRDALVMALESGDLGEARRQQRQHYRVADFTSLPEIIAHAQQEGATHVIVTGEAALLYFPLDGSRYEESRVRRRQGYWHSEGPGYRSVVGQLPYSAKPIEDYLALPPIPTVLPVLPARSMLPDSEQPETQRANESRRTVRDYIAVDTRGRVVGGPFKDYGTAKRHADKARGHVEFKMGKAGHTVRDPSELRYEIEKTRYGWTVVAYSPSGVRMPLTTYPTRDAAVAGMPSDRAAMNNPSYKTMGEAKRRKDLIVVASGVRPTDTGASGRQGPGVDLDIKVTLPDGRVLDGEVTLLPAEDGRPKYAVWGVPENWLDSRTWRVVRELPNYREVLDAIEVAAVDAAGVPHVIEEARRPLLLPPGPNRAAHRRHQRRAR
jgi:hypothetical protein